MFFSIMWDEYAAAPTQSKIIYTLLAPDYT